MAIVQTPLLMIFVFILLIAYFYKSLAYQTIAHKTNTSPSWWAWVPLLDFFLLLRIAKYPLVLFIFFFVPFLNFIFGLFVFGAIIKRLRLPMWWLFISVVPIVNIIFLGLLAWASPAARVNPYEKYDLEEKYSYDPHDY